MTVNVDDQLDYEDLARQIRGNRELANLLRELIREEMADLSPRVRRAGLPQSEMKVVMSRIETLGERMSLSAAEFEALIEEHRREFGRGPLVDEPGESDGA